VGSRINEIRRKISALRAEARVVQDAIRDQVSHDHDCTETACWLIAMRAEMTALIGHWNAVGGGEGLLSVRASLKGQTAERVRT
jgi:hypothetical protein